MLSFKRYLRELFGTEHEFQWQVGYGSYESEFEVGDYTYFLSFEPGLTHGDKKPNNEWHFVFGIDDKSIARNHKGNAYALNSMGMTGTGHAYEVFDHAIAGLKSFIQFKHPNAIFFTAQEPSRIKLYDRFVRLASKALPGYVGEVVGRQRNSNDIKLRYVYGVSAGEELYVIRRPSYKLG